MFKILNESTYKHYGDWAPLMEELRKKWRKSSPITVGVHASVCAFYDARLVPDMNTLITKGGDAFEILSVFKEKGKYKVKSQRIEIFGRSDRFGRRRQRNWRQTSSVAAAAKLIMKYCGPLTLDELYNRQCIGTGVTAHGRSSAWVNDVSVQLEQLLNIPRSDFAEEMKHLVAAGVSFCTPTFQQLATAMIPLTNEVMRRKVLHQSAYTVMLLVEPDGPVTVGVKELGKASFTFMDAYESCEALPAALQDKLALLRFTAQNVYVPEVGERLRDDMFWLFLSAQEHAECRFLCG